ncbi:MAG TPA: serine hydrolase domain-containing protein [Longimicrobiales bacterium]|nr:serine hydrolase domain-containing protein [Longimicrobiales bacterium]
MMSTRLLALALVLAPLAVHAQAYDVDAIAAQLRPEVERTMLEGKIPSATIALVSADRVLWSGAFGYSNLYTRSPATPNTVYLIGSTFKAMSTWALLQQMEAGKFKLDDPVNNYLTDFKVRGETAGRPVTFRHLLTHTSGLPVAFGPHLVWGETVPPSLPDYLRDSLKVVGPPLDSVRYSNLAFSLVGYLVERFAGAPYKQQIQEKVWTPLQMTSTAFVPTPEMEERLAIPYVVDVRTGRNVATQRLKANVWPAGIVYGTVLNQANWLIANLNSGQFRGQRVIARETFDEMMRLQYPKLAEASEDFGGAMTGYGLVWRVTTRHGERLFAHSGSVPGYTALLVGNLDRKIGFAIMTNGNRAHPYLYKLADRALEIMKANAQPVKASGN